MMRFDMTFDNTLSFGKCTNSLFTFTGIHCLISPKANFQYFLQALMPAPTFRLKFLVINNICTQSLVTRAFTFGFGKKVSTGRQICIPLFTPSINKLSRRSFSKEINSSLCYCREEYAKVVAVPVDASMNLLIRITSVTSNSLVC